MLVQYGSYCMADIGCAYVLKLVDYLPEHTHKQYNNLHLCILYNTRKLYNKANVSRKCCVVQYVHWSESVIFIT